MVVSYDPLLVFLSVLIATSGGYTCFHLAERLSSDRGERWRGNLAMSAIAVGGGIWAMHFVGMLAVNIEVRISYDILGTMLSAMIAVGITGAALYIVGLRGANRVTVSVGGITMGLGIVAMHYVGMAAIRGDCAIGYSWSMVALSVAVGIGASILALYLAFEVKKRWKQMPAALVMGLAIAGMHYTAMFAASFRAIESTVIYAAPAFSDSTMAVIVTLVAFVLFGSTFLLAAPAPLEVAAVYPAGGPARPLDGEDDVAEPADEPDLARVPVQENRNTLLLDPEEVVCVHADSHYSTVCTQAKSYFSAHSISNMEDRLRSAGFVRVHRSHLVNLRHVKGFRRDKDHGELIVDADGEERLIPVSRTKIGDIREALAI